MTVPALKQEGQIIHNLPREDYDALPGENFSKLKNILTSPLAYRHSLSAETEDTDAMALGRAVHGLVLEPERTRIAVWDGGARRGREWEAFCSQAKSEDAEVLRADDYATAKRMAEAVHAKPRARGLLCEGRPEVTLCWESNGIRLKGRPDWIGRTIVDLKTTRDASIDGFGREVAQRLYHMQAALYGAGCHAATGEHLPCYLIAVESEAPHDVVVYRIPERIMEQGRLLWTRALTTLQACRQSGSWPGADNGHPEVELSIPAWAGAEG
jgi:exodeoxyribonuclease VIII